MKTCTVCQHPQLNAITGELVARVPLRTIERKYGLSKSALDRHVQHAAAAVKLVNSAEAIAEPVKNEMRKLNARALRILQQAEDAKDHATALTAIRECRRNLELIAKLTGELDPRAAGEIPGAPVNINIVYAAQPPKHQTVEMLPRAIAQEMPIAADFSPVVASLAGGEGVETTETPGDPECQH